VSAGPLEAADRLSHGLRDDAADRSAGLMAAALRGFNAKAGGDGARRDGSGGARSGGPPSPWDPGSSGGGPPGAPPEDDESDFFSADPLDARRLLHATRVARHEHAKAAGGDAPDEAPDHGAAHAAAGTAAVFRKASRRSSKLAALTSLVNELYLPLARPVYEALFPYLAGGELPDVLVMDAATLGARDLADAFRLPLVVNSPSLLHTFGGGNASRLPAWGTGHPKDMALWQRVVNHVLPRCLALALTPALLALNRERLALGLRPHRGPDDLVSSAMRVPRSGGLALGRRGAASFVEGEGVGTCEPGAPGNATGRARARSELTLVNTAFGFDHDRPVPGRVVLTGPLLPAALTSAQTLDDAPPVRVPTLVERWLRGGNATVTPETHRTRKGAKKQARAEKKARDVADDDGGDEVGVVFVCLGRMPRVEPWQAHAIVRGLQPPASGVSGDEVAGDSPAWRVLWALPSDQRSSLPHALPPKFRVKLLGPLSTVAIVAQPDVKVVVSHCGAAAAQEALYFGKPLLCVPFFGDQPDVAARVRDAGAGLVIDKHALSDARVRDAVRVLHANESFRLRARGVADALRAAGGVVAAADAVEKWIGAAPRGGGACGAGDDCPAPPPRRCGGEDEPAEPWHREANLDDYALGVALLCLTTLGLTTSANFILAYARA